MIGLKRHQNVAIPRVQRAVGQVLRVQGAVGQADVVENVVDLRSRYLIADLSLDQVEQAGGFLNAHSRRAADMENELPAVSLREKVFAKERHQNENGETKPQERGNEDAEAEDKFR